MRQSGSRCAVTVALVMPCGGTFRILSSDGVPLARVSRKHRCSKGERSGGQGLVPCPSLPECRGPGEGPAGGARALRGLSCAEGALGAGSAAERGWGQNLQKVPPEGQIGL